ncbi:FecR family protein [Telluria aromaticivorans]|uniref:FecR domain-containing protein n=1 Tax=Telluria aromaticivorans TaxID=2725995 RepID=A0A7Y2JXJ4_9BURK|nr:FecR family protein [Telluria aromaticivorans]NNG22375.1 FecR domain-containing protein [Telluria aromaticivorans]
MKNQLQKCTAIKGLLFAALLGFGGAAWAAQVAGAVTRLSGPLMAKKPDGSVKVLALRSEIESGDTLVSEKNTYAQIRFIDNSEITLRPGTTFKVENFAYDEGKPEADSANFSLVKGGLRSITGLMGKRNKEKFSLKTPSATIGIRGTTFVAQYVPPPPAGASGLNLANNVTGLNQQAGGKVARGPDGPLGIPAAPQGKLPSASGLPPGLHVQVSDGMIVVTNSGGALNFAAGQFGFVPNMTQPPVIVPNNPGLQFTPPPAFNTSLTGANGSGPARPDPNQVDCEVR